MNQQFLTELKAVTAENRIFTDEPMKKHTTFRVGGPADILVQPKGTELAAVIRLCRKYDVPYQVIGNGSNLLVGDRGIRGLVIEMLSKEDEICVEDDCITVGAGMLLSKTANRAADHGLTGMEFAAGIPGSIGGAVVMNAGAYGGEMKDILTAVTVLDQEGNEKIFSAEELELGYRTSCILKKGYIVMRAKIKLKHGEETAIRVRMEELKKQRVEKQPLEYPSAGSTFKRPEGYFAGKLIQDAGLKGYTVGGAQVSEKHSGFVVNRGGATAEEVAFLIKQVQKKVMKQFNVMMQPEVRFVGFADTEVRE